MSHNEGKIIFQIEITREGLVVRKHSGEEEPVEQTGNLPTVDGEDPRKRKRKKDELVKDDLSRNDLIYELSVRVKGPWESSKRHGSDKNKLSVFAQKVRFVERGKKVGLLTRILGGGKST